MGSIGFLRFLEVKTLACENLIIAESGIPHVYENRYIRRNRVSGIPCVSLVFEKLPALTDETRFLRDVVFGNQKYTKKPGFWHPMRQPSI